jgi:hypothetical protein
MRLLEGPEHGSTREHAGARGSTQQEHAAGVLRPAPQPWAWGGHIGAAPWRNRSAHSTVRYYTSPYCNIIRAGRLRPRCSTMLALRRPKRHAAAGQHGQAAAACSGQGHAGARRSTHRSTIFKVLPRAPVLPCSRVLPARGPPTARSAQSAARAAPSRGDRRIHRKSTWPCTPRCNTANSLQWLRFGSALRFNDATWTRVGNVLLEGGGGCCLPPALQAACLRVHARADACLRVHARACVK